MANAARPVVPQLGPQPDVARLTQGLQQATAELANFVNLPPLAQGGALIQHIQQIQQQLQQQTQQQLQFQQGLQQLQQGLQQQTQQQQQFQQELRQQIANIDTNIQMFRNEIRTSRQATEYNSVARLENSAIRRMSGSLTTFRDITTNVNIQGFPATLAQLENMTRDELDPILISLDLPVHGTAITKRQRLKFFIGIVEVRSR